jgi:signal transduction histidine kinase
MQLNDQTASGLLDLIFSAIEDTIVVWDGEGRLVMSNIKDGVGTLRDPIAAGLRCHEALLGMNRRCDGTCPVDRIRRGGAETATMEISDEERDRTFEVRAFAVAGGYTLELVRDVTERRRAEEARLHAERRNAVDALAATVAHEARNPLNAAGLQLLLLERGLERGGPDPRLRERARTVRQELARLELLMTEFIDFARPLHLHRSRVDPRALVDAVRAAQDARAQEAGVALSAECDADAPSVPADRGRVEQALVNLVANALEATPRGGAVTVRARRGPLGLRFEVADTGSGIPAEARARMFDLFFTTKAAGTGLGLPVAKKVVEEHRGLLTWDNPTGGGAVFRIDLPAHAPG